MYWSLQKKSGESESISMEDKNASEGSMADSADGGSESTSTPSMLSQKASDIENEEPSLQGEEQSVTENE